MTGVELKNRITEIFNSVDEETGEFTGNVEELEALQADLTEKIDYILSVGKEHGFLADAIGQAIKKSQARKKSHENAQKKAFSYVEFLLDGNTFESAENEVRYSKAVGTEVQKQSFIEWAKENNRDDLLSYSVEPNKTAIKKAIQDGEEIPFAELTTGKMVVK